MHYFPLFARIRGRDCLLVGAGCVAARKARLLLRAGARLRVVAPFACEEILTLARGGRLTYHRRAYRECRLDGAWLVIAATGDRGVNAQVAADAAARALFCNSVDDPDNSTVIVPALVDRSPLMIAVSTGGTAPVLARRWRERIEALAPSRLGVLAEFAGRWRPAVADAFGTGWSRRRFWERFFDSPLAARLLAGTSSRGEIEREFSSQVDSDARSNTARRGEAWLVGAGPGDPGLLTLRALQLMQRADVVMYDRLVSDEILELVRRDAERIAVGKQAGKCGLSQQEITGEMLRQVRAGRRVCRLKGGDPFIFGRGGEELEALQRAGVDYQVVPGITAAAGCAAYADMPLTHRAHAQALVLVTAHGHESVDRLDWPALARDRQTLAFYMSVARLGTIRRRLLENGLSPGTPFAIVENGTTPTQRIIGGELGTLVEAATRHDVRSPAMLYIGDVAALARLSPGSRPEIATPRRAVCIGESFEPLSAFTRSLPTGADELNQGTES